MSDVMAKTGGTVYIDALSEALECPVVFVSALKGNEATEAAEQAVSLARRGGGRPASQPGDHGPFERGIQTWGKKMNDDGESIIVNQRYSYITSIIGQCRAQRQPGSLSPSDRIDCVVPNRILALPIFAAVMLLVYALAIGGWGAPSALGPLTGPTTDSLAAAGFSPAARGMRTTPGPSRRRPPMRPMKPRPTSTTRKPAKLRPPQWARCRALFLRCWCCFCCWPSWRTAAIWPGSPSLWTVCSGGSASPARALSPAGSHWLRHPRHHGLPDH